VIPFGRHGIRFVGKFEIKDGFSTEFTLRLMKNPVLRVGFGKWVKYFFSPVIRISSTLVPIEVPPSITTGDILGVVRNHVGEAPLAGVAVALSGTGFSTVTDSNGAFSIASVPAGIYSLTLTHVDFLEKTFSVEIKAGQDHDVAAFLNPAVIRSTVANTGWFSERYPLADAHGSYGETKVETPLAIDFVSLAFVKAELVFDSEFHASAGSGRLDAYLNATQQVSALTTLDGWWAGNQAVLGQYLGMFYATVPATRQTLDVTEFVRNNPSLAYFLAAKNLVTQDVRLLNIQLTIYYR
jgi:hypothetical protein